MTLKNTDQFLTSEEICDLNQRTIIENERTIATLSILLAVLALGNVVYGLFIALFYPAPITMAWCVGGAFSAVIFSIFALPPIYRWVKTGHPYPRA